MAKGALAVTVLGGAIVAAQRWSAESWERLQRAAIAFGLIFLGSFPVVGMLLRSNGGPVLELAFLARQESAPRNVLVLLLDELSPESADPIAKVLRDRLSSVHFSSILAAGEHTMNAVPAMLTGRRFDRTMACGATTQCSQDDALDYSRLVARDSVDIVSYVGMYCSIQGLRSCRTIMAEPVESAFDSMLCKIGIPFLDDWCRRQGPGSGLRVATMRADVEAALLSAAFWTQGGLLYAHVPLPHPPANVPNGSLLAEYQANIVASARLVEGVLERLDARFGDEFVLVVTSDHALRVDLHCASPAYRRADCRQGLPENRNRVPLMVGSRKRLRAPNLESAVGLLGGGISQGAAVGVESSSR